MQTTQQPTEPTQRSVDDAFSHMVVDRYVHPNGVGIAHAIGTKAECMRWQLAHGKRATTTVQPV